MHSYSLPTLALLASAVHSAPLEVRQDTNIDTTVLQFALTLEHLENVFYKGALQNFTEQDFVNAGYSANYFNNLKYISFDEQSHVEFLSTALTAAGVKPNEACTYNFPYTDVPSFITLSSVLEGVGTSAYLGGAPLITNKDYLTAAGAILVTEAKHTSYQRAAIAEVPFANPYGTPLDPTSVFTLAAAFIASCPSTNVPLPFTPFPTLTYTGPVATKEEPSSDPSQAIKRLRARNYGPGKSHWGDHWHHDSNDMAPPCAGEKVTFSVMKGKIPEGSFVTFVSGLDVVSVKGTLSADCKEITAKIPKKAQGQSYVFVTKRKVKMLQDSAVLFGPAILEVNPAPPMIDFSES